MSEQISTSFIGNRKKPDELLNAVALYISGEAITASVNGQTTGIIAGRDDPELKFCVVSGLFTVTTRHKAGALPYRRVRRSGCR